MQHGKGALELAGPTRAREAAPPEPRRIPTAAPPRVNILCELRAREAKPGAAAADFFFRNGAAGVVGPAFTISLTHSRARGADDGGRRRRDASYGVARDSHPVSTIR